MKCVLNILLFLLIFLVFNLCTVAQDINQEIQDTQEDISDETFTEPDLSVSAEEDDTDDEKEIICGDGVCYEQQDYFSCPQDCDFFDLKIALTQIRLVEGEPVHVPLRIKQYVNGTYSYNISASSNIEPFVNFENDTFSIHNYTIYQTHLVFNISDRTNINYSFGDLIVENKHEKKEIPVFLELISEDERLLSLNHDVLTKNVLLGEELVYFMEVDFYTSFESNASVNVFLENIETGQRWLVENMSLDSAQSHKRVMDLKLDDSFTNISGYNESLEQGLYNLLVQLDIDDRTLYSYSKVSIEQSFYDTIYFKLLLVLLVSLPILILVIKYYPKFKSYLESRKRYILPSIKELPNENMSGVMLKVGKIPESKYSAYLAARDLNTHAIVAGSTGSGKSVSASIIVEEALNNKIPVVVFDPTSQWTGFLSGLKDEKIFRLYSKFKMSREDARSYKGLIFTPKDADFEINFDEYLNPGEITVFNLANLSTKEYDEATAKIVENLFEKKWEEDPELKVLCVFDEVHRLLEPSCEGKGYAALTRGAREFRKWGIGLLMASQILSDFKEAIGGNVLTEIQLNTKNMNDIKKAEQKYGTAYAKRITRQSIGVALVQNPRYNSGKPWFINFRPPMHNPHKLSEEDLAAYDKFTAKIKDLKQRINDLKTKGEDVSEFELDLNLASNKLKEGKFKMTDIYIEEIEGALNRK
ncbi:MAG: ATP-binding protein [Candidatus Nanoarchaeia archaeon]